MSGHTPGPWTLTHCSGTNFAVQTFEIRGMFCDSPNVSPIFNKSTNAIDGTLIHASPEDARLIAAAPDLLAIAQRILDRGYVSESIDEERGDHLQLRAAIAKAKPA